MGRRLPRLQTVMCPVRRRRQLLITPDNAAAEFAPGHDGRLSFDIRAADDTRGGLTHGQSGGMGVTHQPDPEARDPTATRHQ